MLALADINLDGVEADVYLPGDLNSITYLNALVPQAIEVMGGLDILVNAVS